MNDQGKTVTMMTFDDTLSMFNAMKKQEYGKNSWEL